MSGKQEIDMDEEYARKKALMDWIVAGMAGRHYPKPEAAKQDKTAVAPPQPVKAKPEPEQRTLLGDLHPRNWPRRLEDTFIPWTDNVMDAYNNGWISESEAEILLKKAFNRDARLFPVAGFNAIAAQIDNRLTGFSELSKKRLKERSVGNEPKTKH